MSDWIEVLRRECERSSQKRVGARLGYSASVISQVINRRYPGDLERIRLAVEGAYCGATVDCPAVGEMPRDRCLEHQQMSFSASNPLRVLLARTCPECPNRHKKD